MTSMPPAAPKGVRKEAMAKTREALIDAGLRLAERTGLAGLSVNLIVQEAGVAKGTFFHHFGDRASYLLALHREFHERLATQIQAAIDGMPPGRRRLTCVAHTYLDGCLRDRGVRALLLEARAEPAVTDEIARRNHASAELCEADFVALLQRFADAIQNGVEGGRSARLRQFGFFGDMFDEFKLIHLASPV